MKIRYKGPPDNMHWWRLKDLISDQCFHFVSVLLDHSSFNRFIDVNQSPLSSTPISGKKNVFFNLISWGCLRFMRSSEQSELRNLSSPSHKSATGGNHFCSQILWLISYLVRLSDVVMRSFWVREKVMETADVVDCLRCFSHSLFMNFGPFLRLTGWGVVHSWVPLDL